MTDYDRGYMQALSDLLKDLKDRVPYGAIFQKYDDCRNTTVPTDPTTYHVGDDPETMGGGDTEGRVW